MGGNGYGPTKASVDVFADRQKEITAAQLEYAKLIAAVEAFNRTSAVKIK
jgi:hypothetical protein